MNKKLRNLVDTPFSLERLFVWSIAIYGLIGTLAMAILSFRGKPIPPQIQSLTMFCAGGLMAKMEGKRRKE